MTTESILVQRELEEELCNLAIIPAQPCETEYYHKWKNESYPLNLDSDKRARAIMFTMTERRPGWEQDVRSLHQMLKSFNVDVERVYDPDYVHILTSLKAFVENEENNLIDMCFIIFMGHGCTTIKNEHDVNLEIEGGFFNIWSESVNIFRKETSLLREKPKVFIVQSCRSVDHRMEDSGAISLRSPSSFTDYKFVYASQPGMVADREHHFFIDTLTSLVTKEAHRNHLCDLINKKLLLEFKKKQNHPGVKGQMPQICESLPHFLNTFPGITKYYLDTEGTNGETPQQEFGGNTDYLREAIALPVMETMTDEFKGSNPQMLPVGTKNNNQPKTKDANANSQQTKTEKSVSERKDSLDNTECEKNKADENKADSTKDKENNTNCHVILKIQTTVQPESNCQNTQQALLDHLKEKRNQVETSLSEECESPVMIDEITLGSILIHISCDVKALEPLRFLSETGLLSSKFTNLLVTEELLEKCNVCQVTLDVKLNIPDKDMLKTLSPMIYNLPFILSFLGNTFLIKAPVQTFEQIQWFHNDVPIIGGDRIQIVTEEDKSYFVKVNDACVADTGVYSCEYTSADGFPVLVKGSVLVLNQSLPSNVTAVAETYVASYVENTIDVSWDHAVGDITGYNIIYSPGLAGGSPQTVLTGVTTNGQITDLLPGETYNISVCSVSDEGVSDPEPPEGITVHTPPETPVSELIQIPYVSGLNRVRWEKPRKNGVYIEVTLSDIGSSITANKTYVIPSETETLNIELLKTLPNLFSMRGFRCKQGTYFCTVYSLYKGVISKKMDLKKGIELSHTIAPAGFVIEKSPQGYYKSKKDESYRISRHTLKRGRAIVFITGGKEMQYRTDFDLLRLLAALSVSFWLIYDPDVDTVDYYLKQLVQRKEQDVVDYCLLFFIGSRVGDGINTHFVTEKMESFNIYDKCINFYVQQTKPEIQLPVFVFTYTSVACEALEMSSEVQSPLNDTDPSCSDMYFLYTNSDNESSKWQFLNSWVDCVIDESPLSSLDDITRRVVNNFTRDSEETRRPFIISTLTKQLNLFPHFTERQFRKRKLFTNVIPDYETKGVLSFNLVSSSRSTSESEISSSESSDEIVNLPQSEEEQMFYSNSSSSSVQEYQSHIEALDLASQQIIRHTLGPRLHSRSESQLPEVLSDSFDELADSSCGSSTGSIIRVN